MTEQQYKEYTEIKNEVNNLKKFLRYCGKKYYAGSAHHKFAIKTFEKIKHKFFLYEKDGWDSLKDSTYELPKELQGRIIEVVEGYVEEREKEMEKI